MVGFVVRTNRGVELGYARVLGVKQSYQAVPLSAAYRMFSL